MMVSDEEIDWAVQVMENPKAPWTHKWLASEIADAFLRQELQTLDWLHLCYFSRNVARMGQRHYGNRANRAGTR